MTHNEKTDYFNLKDKLSLLSKDRHCLNLDGTLILPLESSVYLYSPMKVFSDIVIIFWVNNPQLPTILQYSQIIVNIY